MIRSIIREPLFHFLLLSAGVFAFFATDTENDTTDVFTIRVTENDIAHLMQSMDPNLTRDAAQTRLLQLPKPQREHLLKQYVENEVLYREALQLGLDQNDAVVRQRLIQRVRFMLQGLRVETAVNEQDAYEFFAQNRSRYLVPAKVSFKHRFFKDEGNDNQARLRALSALEENTSAAEDPFPYHKAYLDRTETQVGQHCVGQFARNLMQLEPKPDVWQGPIQSAFGQHLVLVTSQHPSQTPSYESIQERVLEDLRRIKREQLERTAISKVVSKYQILSPSWL